MKLRPMETETIGAGSIDEMLQLKRKKKKSKG